MIGREKTWYNVWYYFRELYIIKIFHIPFIILVGDDGEFDVLLEAYFLIALSNFSVPGEFY